VLVVAHEHGLVLADGTLELCWWDWAVGTHPQAF
jgi:hypothetical protein